MIEKNHRESNECCHAQLSARWLATPKFDGWKRKTGAKGAR
ncbi:hypothetical protein [Rhizobium sp. R693]|nr:hypothetical protein [Rhizobium sp. R693]